MRYGLWEKGVLDRSCHVHREDYELSYDVR